MAYRPHPAFHGAFTAYTSEGESIGTHLARSLVQARADAPLLVTTGTDIVLFPGGKRAPRLQSFRRSTRGFIELCAISRLGCAVAWIMRLRELGNPVWRADAQRLITEMLAVREVNSEAHWRDNIAVAAFAGLEARIADMVDYTCAITIEVLGRELASPQGMSWEELRQTYLDPRGSAEVPVPINDVMAATFALAFLDIGHRVNTWLHGEDMDWERMMVMISGRTGRVTSGLSWATNNMCHLLWRASGQRLTRDQVHIAPHAPALDLEACGEPADVARLEEQFRWLWLRTGASVEMASRMFDGYPAYRQRIAPAPMLEPGATEVDGMPTLRSVDDRLAIMTRLRLVLEDPEQLISNAAAHDIIDQLSACGNRPGEVFIFGLSDTHYPKHQPAPATATA